MRWLSRIAITLALVSVGCTPELKPDEVTSTLFGKDRGALAGYDFGDSWEKIKKEHDPKLKLRDEKGFEQLRYDLSSPGDNGFFISFGLEGGDKVKSLGASIYGRKQNAVTVRRILDDVIAHFDKTVGQGSCAKSGGPGNSSSCDWPARAGKPGAHVDYLEMSDPIWGHLEIRIVPAKP